MLQVEKGSFSPRQGAKEVGVIRVELGEPSTLCGSSISTILATTTSHWDKREDGSGTCTCSWAIEAPPSAGQRSGR